MKPILLILYNLTKYPLSFLFFKTPLKYLVLRYMRHYRSLEAKNIFNKFLSKIFWEEYFYKLKNFEEKDKIRNLTLSDGEGRLWASQYFNEKFESIEDLKKIKIGDLSKFDSDPIYAKIINFLDKCSKSLGNKNICVIQIGSSSGRDLKFFRNHFSEISYISTDINDEILNFQKEKYNYKNFYFFKSYAFEIEKCFEYFKLSNKKKIIFSIGSSQYLSPPELDNFFKILKKFKNIDFFLQEPVSRKFLEKKLLFSHRHDISYNHEYENYAKKNNINIIDKKITFPYNDSSLTHYDVCHYYIHCRS